MTFKIGDEVTTVSSVRPARFADRKGVVSSFNRRDDEIGLSFGGITTWFRSGEVGPRMPHRARTIRSGDVSDVNASSVRKRRNRA